MSFMTWWTLGIVLGLTLLTVLFTGPGMWSEKWGWSWLERREKRAGRRPRAKAPDQGSPTGAGATSREDAPPAGEGAPRQIEGPPRR